MFQEFQSKYDLIAIAQVERISIPVLIKIKSHYKEYHVMTLDGKRLDMILTSELDDIINHQHEYGNANGIVYKHARFTNWVSYNKREKWVS